MKICRRRILSVFLIFTLCLLCVGTITPVKASTIELPYEVYIPHMRVDLDENEIASADALNIAIGSDFDPADLTEGITFDETAVDVSYLEEYSEFDIDTCGRYHTYYQVNPKSGKRPYLIARDITVYDPEDNEVTETTDEAPEGTDVLIGETRNEYELPLSLGEITSIQSSTASFSISLDENMRGTGSLIEETEDDEPGLLEKVADFLFPSMVAKAAGDTLKVTYSGYVSYCNHRMGYKYISTDGDYKNHLVYCLNLSKRSTNSTVTAGSKNVPAKITFCLVNGARTKGGLCHTDKYSSGTAEKDYFITSAAIHVLNGEVKLSYYNDGSGVYKNIKQMVDDAKDLNKSEYDTTHNTTKSVSYSISPTKSQWTEYRTGLYRSEQKFVRSKDGPITNVTYKISGAPSGLTTGEIAKDSSDISDEGDLSRYDICVAQTDKDKPSSNFYLYANQEAMDKIIAEDATIKVVATVHSPESRGRSWVPTIVSEQNVTFLEKNIPSTPITASVKVKVGESQSGSILIKKVNTYTNMVVNGAVYGLYEDEECNELVCELVKQTEHGDGLYAGDIDDLSQSVYYLKEISNPTGYMLDETVHRVEKRYFTLKDAAGNVTQEGEEYEVSDLPEPVSVMIQKKDATDEHTIQNAKFAVFDDEACTTRTMIDPARPEKGEVPLLEYDDDLDAYVSEGFMKMQDYYYVKEVDVPTGYGDSGQVYSINPDYGEMITIDVENTPIKCELHAKKEDAEKKTPQGDATLAGAVYGLYAKNNIYKAGGEELYNAKDIQATEGTELVANDVEASAGTLLATIKTDVNGAFGFKELPFGDYTVKEITPSEGYLLNETPYDVDFTASGNTNTTISLDLTVVETVKKQAFEIIKIEDDGTSGEGLKLKGAEFTVKLASEVARSGWEQAETYDTLVTDDVGFARSKELPYGTYTVRETVVPKDHEGVKDFTVQVTEDSRTPQPWKILNNAPFMSYIRLIKKDEELKTTVLLKDTTFKIRKAGETDYISQKVGDKDISEFITDEKGTVTTPLKLKYGNYEVVEIKAPDGYVLRDTPVPFTVTSDGAVKVDKDKDGDPVIDVIIENKPVKGRIKITKTGEVLSGIQYDTIIDRILDFFTGDQRSVRFLYEEVPLAGATFDVIADENIYTPDHQVDEKKNRTLATYNGKPVSGGAVVATITTDDKGEAVVDGLPLGKYHLIETKTPKGYAPDEKTYPVELTYKDEKTPVIEQTVSIKNERQKTEVKVIKEEAAVSGPAVSGGIEPEQTEPSPAVSPSAATLTPSPIASLLPTATESIIPTATTSQTPAVSGTATSMPVSSPAVSASASPAAAMVTPSGTPVTTMTATPTLTPTLTPTVKPQSSTSPLRISIVSQATSGSAIVCYNEDTAGNPVEGATYGIFSTTEIKNYKGEVLIPADTLITAEKTDANGEILFDSDLPLGKFYLKEIDPAPGYTLDQAEYEVDFTNPDPTKKVIRKEYKLSDKPIILFISKADLTTGFEIPDAKLQVIDKNDEVFAEWVSDGKPYMLSSIPAGDYTLREVAAPDGYYIQTEAEFSVDDTGVIKKVTMVDERLIMQIQIIKTDRDTEDPIAGVQFLVSNNDGYDETIETNEDGIATTVDLPVGTYNADGTLSDYYTYDIMESKAAEGYIRSDAVYHVSAKDRVKETDLSEKEPIVLHRSITNKPKVPKLPQTGGDHTPWPYLLGTALLAGAGAFVYRKKKTGGFKR